MWFSSNHFVVSKILWLGLFLCLLGQLSGHNRNYSIDDIKTFPFRHFTPGVEVGRTVALYFEQDSEGYMWVATDRGLFRFDGHEFVRYANDSDNIHSLSDDFVISLFNDSTDRLWVGTNTGLHRYRPAHNNFERIPLILHDAEGETTSPIKRILEDVYGRLYLATSGGGVKVLEKGDLSSYALSSVTKNPPEGMDQWVVNRINLDGSGALWISTIRHGIFRFFAESGIIQPVSEFKGLDHALDGHEVRSFYKDRAGNLWIGTHGNGIIRWNEETNYIVHYAKGQKGDRPLNCESIRHMLEDKNGYLWVSSQDAGIFVYDSDTDEFVEIPHLDTQSPQISEELITAMFLDSRGDLWFSAFSSGLSYVFYLDLDPGGFRRAVIKNKKGVNINKKAVLTYFEDSRGNTWVGTDAAGLIRWDKSADEAIVYDENDSSAIFSSSVTAIAEDEYGNLWFGSRGNGLIKLDIKSGEFSRVASGETAASVRGYSIWSLLADDGFLWIGTDQGLSVIDLQAGAPIDPKQVLGESFVMPKRAVWSIIRDQQGRLLICSISGFYTAKPSRGSGAEAESEGVFHIVSKMWARTVCEDSEGKIWVGAFPGGLFLLDEENSLVRPFQEGKNLESDNVLSVTEGSEGGLWVTSHTGFSKLDRTSGEVLVFDSNWVRDSPPLWVHRNVPGKDGNIYFPSRRGLLFYDVHQVRMEKALLKPRLTGIEIFGKEFSDNVNASDGLFINPADSDLVLKPTESALTFHYSALYYPQPEDVEYQVYLYGYDREWRKPASLSRMSYKLLPPGKYSLHLRARLRGQEWGAETVPLAITVSPPLYFRWWFIGGVVVVLVVFVYALMRIRMRESVKQRVNLEKMVDERTLQLAERNLHISRQRDELEYHRNHLEEIVEERTGELELAKERAEESSRLKTAFLANMSHEIRTPLNSIVNFSQLLFDQQLNENERRKFKDIVENSSTSLLRLIEDVLDIARLEAGELKLEEKPCDILALLRGLREIYLGKIRVQQRSLTILLSCPVDFKVEIETDATRLNQILVNLLDNALKFTEEGNVEFGFSVRSKYLEFFVQDSGIGIADKYLETIFDRFTKVEEDRRKIFPGAGLGLAIAKRLVNLLGGRIWVESEKEKGSVFYFSIPNKVCLQEDLSQSEMRVVKNFDWSNHTILVVEDEYSNVEVIKAFLSPTSANVLYAGDGEEAVSQVQKESSIDLILMDLKLPILDGVAATRKIRTFNKDIPIIAQTAYGISHERMDTLRNGFNDYVTKPLNRDRLLSSIDHYLNRF